MKNNDKYENVTRSRKEIIINNFLGGISWAVGTIIGAGIVVGGIGLIVTKLENVDLIGPFIETILQKIEEGQDKLGK